MLLEVSEALSTPPAQSQTERTTTFGARGLWKGSGCDLDDSCDDSFSVTSHNGGDTFTSCLLQLDLHLLK